MSRPDDGCRHVLDQQLSDIVGIEDVEDVRDMMDMFLQMDYDELKEYIESLLGSSIQEEDKVQIFLSNVTSFQQGGGVESIISFPSAKVGTFTKKDKEKPLAIKSKQRTEKTSVDKQSSLTTAKTVIPQTKHNINKNKIVPQKQEKLLSSEKAINDQDHHEIHFTDTEYNKNSVAELSKASVSNITNPQNDANKNHSSSFTTKLPQKGKATYNCGCFGVKHKALTNCLYCGRIVCQKEGYGYCPFCENLITQSGSSKKNDRATLHKERLLQFDREFTKRTVIYDAQSDYYNHNSSWLDETERSEQLQKEEQRKKQLHERQKQTLQIQFE